MSRRAQVAVYVLIGMALLFGLVMFLAFRPAKGVFSSTDTAAMDVAVDRLYDCAAEGGEDALRLIGRNGGSIGKIEDTITIENITIARLHIGANSTFDREAMARGIADHVDAYLQRCIADIESTSNVRFMKRPDVGATIMEDSVVMAIGGVRLSDGQGFTRTVPKATIPVEVRFGRILDEVERVLARSARTGPVVDPYSLGEEQISMRYGVVDESFVFQVRDDLSDRNVTFVFAVTYEPPDKRPPLLAPIPDLTLKEGEPFSYKVKAESPANRTLFFIAETPLFTMDPFTGDINFTPTIAHVGEHFVLFRVIDEEGEEDTQLVTISVLTDRKSVLLLWNQTAKKDELFEYAAIISGPPSARNTFRLVSAPTNATIDPQTGFIRWNATIEGNSTFIVHVNNSYGEDWGEFIVEVTP